MTQSPRPRVSALAGVAALAALALLLAGCVTPAAEPSATPTPEPEPSATSTSTPTPTPEPPAPVFDGAAVDNLAYFDQLNRELIDSGKELNGAAFIDNLVKHGYPRSAMEVTPDRTAIWERADNIVFSIRFGDTCLLGQWGNIGYASSTAEVLSTGRCLVGTARPA